MGDHEQLDPEIAVHYASVSEQQRLGPWSLERVRTWELLGRHLPPPPAVVLDIGGPPGSTPCPWPPRATRSTSSTRWRCTSSRPCAPRPSSQPPRWLRPGGVLAAAAISRFASTLDGLLRGYLDEPGFEAIVERDLRDGQHRNPTGRPEWFTTAYFHLPEELAQEVGEAGLRLHALLAVEGPAWMLADIQQRLADPTRRERLLAAIRRVQTEPSLLGASSHLLAVAHR
jgi:hypothetical protein